ncbi:MAG: flap endonuclease-1 [Candidatus Pacearchaeota archaeon]
MGVDIGKIVPRHEISLDFLSGKIIAIDAYNMLYQFLTTIRQPDGTLLMDSQGNITSHLSGLYYRTMNLLYKNIKPIFVFDGKSPEEKYGEKEKREKIKKEAAIKYEKALEEGAIEEAAKYARMTASLTADMVKEAKALIDAMGLPWIQAPSEGEAQAAYMTRKDKAIFAVASQDYDALIFGAQRLVINLTLAKKRKLASGALVPISPELVVFDELLNVLGIDHDMLIALAILVGTDFNPGVRGIGPIKGLKLVKQFKSPYELFKWVEKTYGLEFSWQEIFEIFKKPNIKRDFSYSFGKPNKQAIIELLCNKHDFSEERVLSALEKLEKEKTKHSQESLGKFL